MILEEKTYLFNPFNLKKVTDETISEHIDEISNKYRNEADTPYDVAFNIELGANLLCLYGEMISRLTERYQIKKLDNNKGEMLETHRLRTQWSKTNEEKAPAISYFEALAVEKFEISRQEEYKLYGLLTRFKYAYESLEAKMNAWKKKLEAFKYEVL